MDQISHNTNFNNPRIHSYDEMSKIIVKLDSKNGDRNYEYSPKITDL